MCCEGLVSLVLGENVWLDPTRKGGSSSLGKIRVGSE